VLRNWHCDQNEDLEMAIRDFSYRRNSIALSVHEFDEVVCPLSIGCLESKIYFSRSGENVPPFVVLPKKICIRYGIVVQQFQHCH